MDRLGEEEESAQQRWGAPRNSELWVNLHLEGVSFGLYAAERLPKSGSAPILAPHEMLESVRRWRRSLAVLRGVVGVARYVADHGAHPVGLDSLVPRYLPEPPVDPSTGHALRYAGGQVWAMRPDRTDAASPLAGDEARYRDTGPRIPPIYVQPPR
jgi:hypothetical protein